MSYELNLYIPGANPVSNIQWAKGAGSLKMTAIWV
jgi:hypothetical protein